MASDEDAAAVLWEEIDCANIRPVRTALLSAQGSSFHLIREKRGSSRRVWSTLTSAFLPEGYPGSVTSDYLSFQFWDTIQGLCTYIRSMLSTQALLSGIGVGQTTATIMGATFQWFLRDFTGMLGGVIFTIYQGTNLDSKAKQWRLTADFMNDIGMLLDLLSPLFPDLFVILLCVGSLARSVTGVASGATRAALTQHFALQQNAADISAKEGSQETAATLSGMILGMLLANLTAGHTVAIWICFLSLTCFHMYANYKAVGSLCLTSLNKERTSIALHSFLTTGKVPTPLDVSAKEVILPQLFSLSYFSKKVRHQPNQNIIFGARISSINIHEGWKIFPQLVKRYAKDNYLMFLQDGKIYVILHKQAKKDDYLKSYIHALVAASLLDNPNIEDAEISSNVWMQNSYPIFMLELQAHGWNSDRVLVYPDTWRAQWSSKIDLKSE